MKIITVTLSPAFDIHCNTESFAAEHENFANITSYDAGGKGINLSRALLACGTKSLAIVAVGKENGASFLSALDSDALSYKSIELEGRIRENVTIHVKDKKETRLSFNGFVADKSLIEKVKNIILENANEGDVVAIVGSLPSGTKANDAKELICALHQAKIKVVIDSRSFTPEDIAECSPFLIKPNEEEIVAYVGKSISTLGEAAEAAKSIKARGIENVMISLGARGAVLASDDGIFVAEAPKIEALSTIGAGDSSIAGFLYAHINEMGYGECLRHAIAYGSAACLTEGTKPPREEDVKRLLDEVRVNT